MTETAPDPFKRLPTLVISDVPGRVEQSLLGTYRAGQVYGQGVLDNVVLDRQVSDVPSAIVRLKTYFMYEDSTKTRPYYFVIIEGSVARRLAKRDLEAIRKNAHPEAGEKLMFLGIAETGDDKIKLTSLGIDFILDAPNTSTAGPVSVSQQHFQIYSSAANARRALIERLENEANAARAKVIIKQGPTDKGILPDGGLIVVHGTKGGVGKSTISANIAQGLAAAGNRTILVDLNPDGAHVHQEFWHEIRKEGYESPEELLTQKGLTALSRRIDFQSTSGFTLDDVAACSVMINENLWILPGISDQSDYMTNRAQVGQTLSNPAWINNLIDWLNSTRGGFQYIVVDTGTNKYTAYGHTAITRAGRGGTRGLLVIVIEMKDPLSVDDEVRALRQIYEQEEVAAVMRIDESNHLVIANQVLDLPGAPTVKDLKPRLEFFGADQIIPVRMDIPTILRARAKKRPVLALDDLPPTATLKEDLMGVVNAIRAQYEHTGGESKGLFGKLRRAK